MVAEGDAELIGFDAAVVGEVQTHQARADHLGDVVAVYSDAERRHWIRGFALVT
ncbi:hypothetical protein D3C78_1011320 [compost metagenome]